ncbi:MAG TPA: 16S rRNA (uracil(1498)-N(3))-methyltransferase [Thermoanaerobaculia bacterium]|jgi:RsmE family RNA methyltransferase|nr:16S rRNA (uracil(1498)-N(3))-methyltransferase [Thermoanaerobaculia bacterium]
MNLILLFDDDFIAPSRVVLRGRRASHVREIHRAAAGDELVVGRLSGKIGSGRILRIGEEVEMEVILDRDPPPALEMTLVIALPRPKVLNRVIAAVASLGVKRLFLINAWRVEKSYWRSPRLSEENLRAQAIIGLEQARDTVLPRIETKRLFRPFVEEELPSVIADTIALAAHPYASDECPRNLSRPITLAIGPEGGFIDKEIDSLTRIGFRAVTMGPRILRVETAVAALTGRLSPR